MVMVLFTVDGNGLCFFLCLPVASYLQPVMVSVTGYRLLVTRYQLLVTGYQLLFTGYRLMVDG